MLEYNNANLMKLEAMREAALPGRNAFKALSHAAFADGAIPRRAKELISLAVAIRKQCPCCIDIHGKHAREQGVTDAEVTEATLIAAAIGAGASVTHGTHQPIGMEEQPANGPHAHA